MSPQSIPEQLQPFIPATEPAYPPYPYMPPPPPPAPAPAPSASPSDNSDSASASGSAPEVAPASPAR